MSEGLRPSQPLVGDGFYEPFQELAKLKAENEKLRGERDELAARRAVMRDIIDGEWGVGGLAATIERRTKQFLKGADWRNDGDLE